MNPSATPSINPPLAYNRQAIVDHLCHQATNGPAYVQHSATKALARMKGLFEIGRLSGRHTYEVALATAEQLTANVVEQTKEHAGSVYDKITAIRNGTYVVTDEDLGEYAPPSDDEEEGNVDDDEPP